MSPYVLPPDKVRAFVDRMIKRGKISIRRDPPPTTAMQALGIAREEVNCMTKERRKQ